VTITAVIFDFDGVLADTERMHLRATQGALAAHGWTLDEQTYFAQYLGFGDRDLVVEFARDGGFALDEATLDAIVAAKALRYRDDVATGDALYATAAACVQRLGARFSLAIASGSLHEEIHNILVAGGLRDAFRAIVGADDVTNGKPSAEPYLKAAALLEVEPSAAVAIEDSRWGLESARAAGMRTIAVTTSYPASALSMADLIVDSLDEIPVAAIERLAMR
jgi:beta-phosphoglucomutase